MSLCGFPFPGAKPYGLEMVTNQTVLLFALRACATDDRLRPDGFIQFEPEDYVLLYPHWYRANEHHRLQWVGATRVSSHHAAATRVADWRLDLETLQAHALRNHSPIHQDDVSFMAFLNLRYVCSLPGEELPASMFPPCSFVFLGTLLYATDRQGILASCVEEVPAHIMRDKQMFPRRFKELTGIDIHREVQALGILNASHLLIEKRKGG